MINNWQGFDYVTNDSDKLVVTIGESWTWGDSLQSSWANKKDNKEFRLRHVYGGQLSKMLNADFLNIAEPGQSNLWIADHLEYFIKNIDKFNYKEIIVILTLTEVGREFQGDRDTDRDYVNDMKEIDDMQVFLSQLSLYIGNKISAVSSNNIKLLIGTNFVDSNYTNIDVLEKTWVDLIAEKSDLKIKKPCYVISSWVIERFPQLLNFAKKYSKEKYLEDVSKLLNSASTRVNFLLSSKLNYKVGTQHPTAEGHQIWANYLLKKINNEK